MFKFLRRLLVVTALLLCFGGLITTCHVDLGGGSTESEPTSTSSES